MPIHKRRSLILYIFFHYHILMLTSCMLSSKSTKKLLKEAEKNGPYDLIVVPGIPFDKGEWSRTMKARVYWSKYLFEKGIAKNIMYSGGAVYTPYVEAEVMALYGAALGIPKENIFTETKAEHSTENMYYSYKKAKKLNFNRIALATDPFQTKMLRRFVRKKVSEDIDCIPMVLDTLKAMEPGMIDPVIDYESTKVKDFKSLPDKQGFFKRLRGTRGLNIDKKAYE